MYLIKILLHDLCNHRLRARLAFLLSIIILFFTGNDTVAEENLSQNWILPSKVTDILRESNYGLTVNGGFGGFGAAKLGNQQLGYRNSISFVECKEGFAPDLVKQALQDWFDNATNNGALDGDANHSTMGSKESGMTNHLWQYQSTAIGIVGTLSVWFPDTGKERLKMIITIDERRSIPEL